MIPARQSSDRLRTKVKVLYRKARGWNIGETIAVLTRTLRGWVNYFKLSAYKKIFEELDQWLRRKLRCILWRQWKRPRTRYKYLLKLGLEENRARRLA
ncbi:MAG: hypothetical protein KKI09_14270 [Spirochaetes bacterium]|nr:hypothetical protein [Spirochaetota bacterium]MBU0956593.1 hypothetical protein [Spirochaetota bacterium]